MYTITRVTYPIMIPGSVLDSNGYLYPTIMAIEIQDSPALVIKDNSNIADNTGWFLSYEGTFVCVTYSNEYVDKRFIE